MLWFDGFDRIIADQMPAIEVLREEPMARHTTFRVGGPARRLVKPASTAELITVLQLAQEEKWPVLVVGSGSNLLVSDNGVDCLVIQTGSLANIELVAENQIRAEAGISLPRLAVFAQKHSLAGLEFAHGIPGSLGGAVCMNAGAYGGEMCQVVRSVTAWFPEEGVRQLEPEELEFSYRHSIFSRRKGVVLAAEFVLQPDDGEAIKSRMEELITRRREKQPLEYPSAGSTFKRPVGYYAGALIEQSGLKGFQIGGARVSEKHAGFVINVGGATCADILALMEHVQKTVRQDSGVELEPEVKIVG